MSDGKCPFCGKQHRGQNVTSRACARSHRAEIKTRARLLAKALKNTKPKEGK